MYQRIFSAKNGVSAKKAVFCWIIGVIILESVISLLGLVGSVAATKGIMPDIVKISQEGIQTFNEAAMLQARQSGSESVIPAIAKFAGLPLILGVLLVSTMMAIIVSTADSFLLIPATNLTKDVYQKYLNPKSSEKQILFLAEL